MQRHLRRPPVTRQRNPNRARRCPQPVKTRKNSPGAEVGTANRYIRHLPSHSIMQAKTIVIPDHPTLESQKKMKLMSFGGEMDLPGEQKEMPSDSTITLQDPRLPLGIAPKIMIAEVEACIGFHVGDNRPQQFSRLIRPFRGVGQK